MKSVKADSLGKTSLGTVPAGAFAVVACPAGMTATKDDGFGGKVPFTEGNAQAGTGANGASLTVGGNLFRSGTGWGNAFGECDRGDPPGKLQR